MMGRLHTHTRHAQCNRRNKVISLNVPSRKKRKKLRASEVRMANETDFETAQMTDIFLWFFTNQTKGQMKHTQKWIQIDKTYNSDAMRLWEMAVNRAARAEQSVIKWIWLIVQIIAFIGIHVFVRAHARAHTISITQHHTDSEKTTRNCGFGDA